MKLFHIAIASTLLFSQTALFAQLLRFEHEPVARISVSVRGDAPEYDTKAITKGLLTQEGMIFSQADFDTDLKALYDQYDRVEPKVSHQEDGQIVIELELWPKPVIAAIDVDGNAGIESKKILKELGLKVGEAYDRNAMHKGFGKLKQLYVDKGYFEAELNYTLSRDDDGMHIVITVKEGRAGFVKTVHVTGVSKKEELEILDALQIQEYNFLTSWVTGKGSYQEEMLDADKRAVLNYLHNQGFADAKVEASLRKSNTSPHRVNISFAAKKGQVYTVDKVSVEGNAIFDTATILRYFGCDTGEVFSPEAIRLGLNRLTDLYGQEGYIEAIVSHTPKLHSDAPKYDIHLTIKEKESFRVGVVRVFGNAITQSNVLLHETLLMPGEVFDLVKLKKTQERLENIGYFKNVNVYPVKTKRDVHIDGSPVRDVHIEVEERSTGNLGLALGFTTTDRIYGSFDILERNFNYKGLSTFSQRGFSGLRGGGEYAHLRLSAGERTSSQLLSWTKPYFNDTDWIFGFDIERETSVSALKVFKFRNLNFGLHATYQYNAWVNIGWHYRYKLMWSTIDFRKAQESNVLVSQSMEKASSNTGELSATGVTLSYDSTNHPMRATQGLRSQLMTEIAGLGGSYNFGKVNYTNSSYLALGPKAVLKGRADARSIITTGRGRYEDLPLTELLFMGGESTVRGFRYNGIGPKFGDTREPRGGLSSTLLSAELSYLFHKRLDGFVFYDAGHLSAEEFDFRIDRLKCSLGYGVRLSIMPNSPPVMLGIGYPLNAETSSDVRRFFLNLGTRF